MYCHGKKNNTSGRKSAFNFKQRNDFSCFAVCTIWHIYTHTPINKQVQSMQFLERTNSTTYPSRCGFKTIQIQLILRWLITTLNKVDDFVYYPLYQSLQRVSPRYLQPPLRITSPHYSSFNNHVHGNIDSSQAGTAPHFFNSYHECGINVYIIYIYISLICIIYEI